jgi:hypothetical protein
LAGPLPFARVKRRLAQNVVRLCAMLPVKHIADYVGMGWDAVKQIDREHLFLLRNREYIKKQADRIRLNKLVHPEKACAALTVM